MRTSHHSPGQKPAGRLGTSDSCLRSCSASTSRLLLPCLLDEVADLRFENGELGFCRIRQRPENEQAARIELDEPGSHDFPQPALDPVALDGVATALDTMKPTRAAWESSFSLRLWAMRWSERTRTPALKTRLKSSPCRRRCASGITFRPRLRNVPCDDAMPGWRGPHGCACADGSRASWRACGCWAGKYACSLGSPISRLRVNASRVLTKTAVRVSTAEHSCA